MKTIVNNVNNTIVIKNSKFITELFPLSSPSEVKDYLLKLEQKYPKATHYCYAYITKESKHYSDDKEPSNTAGLPMLNVLEHQELINILAVTVRYFGGIKLGPGGLIRAYQQSVKDALTKATIKNVLAGYQVKLIIPYTKQKQLDYLLKNISYTKDFNSSIIYLINIPQTKLSLLKNYDYDIIKDIFIFDETS